MLTPKYGLLGPDPNKELYSLYVPGVTLSQLPENVSYEYLFPPVKNQGQAGTCATFSSTSLLEALLYKRIRTYISLSERALYSLTKHTYESTQIDVEGLYLQDALQVLQKIGYVLEQAWPYTDNLQSIIEDVPTDLIRSDHLLKDFYRVNGSNLNKEDYVTSMRLALFEQGPLVIGIQFQKDWEQPLNEGFLQAQPTLGVAGGHSMAIVGYSTTKQAFRVRNSWGPEWGDNGYCWLPFNSVVLPDDAYSIII